MKYHPRQTHLFNLFRGYPFFSAFTIYNCFFWAHLVGFLGLKKVESFGEKNRIDEAFQTVPWVASEMIMATWVKRNPKTIKSGFSWIAGRKTHTHTHTKNNTKNGGVYESFVGEWWCINFFGGKTWVTKIHAKLWCFMKLKSSQRRWFHRPKSKTCSMSWAFCWCFVWIFSRWTVPNLNFFLLQWSSNPIPSMGKQKVYLPIHTWLICMVNVGKYTMPLQVGIQSPNLRMVSWNLNTSDWTPLAHHLRIWLDA